MYSVSKLAFGSLSGIVIIIRSGTASNDMCYEIGDL